MKVRRATRRRNPVIASVQITGAGAMTTVGRRAVGGWLRRQARNVERHGLVYAKLHRAQLRKR